MALFDEYKFRCSGLGDIMGYPEKKELPVGAMTACKKIHREVVWKRYDKIKSKYLDKGNYREEDAITMLSRHLQRFMKKNTERLNNGFITGEPDLYEGETIRTAIEGWDTKCAWSAFTMPYGGDKLDSGYVWQAQGYMALTGAEKWNVVYCLLNTPTVQIDDMKRRKMYEMVLTPESAIFDEGYIKACTEIERDHIYDMAFFKKENPHYDLAIKDWSYDIPAKDRIMIYNLERDNDKIEQINQRVQLCRKYLNTL